jgi:hypothetical protein
MLCICDVVGAVAGVSCARERGKAASVSAKRGGREGGRDQVSERERKERLPCTTVVT